MLRAAHPGLPFLLGDGTALPFPDARFGPITLCFALHENPVPVRAALLAEARRVLRPGDTLLVADYRAPLLRLPEHLTALAVACVERLAGREHFAHYRHDRNTGATRATLRLAESFRTKPSPCGLPGKT